MFVWPFQNQTSHRIHQIGWVPWVDVLLWRATWRQQKNGLKLKRDICM